MPLYRYLGLPKPNKATSITIGISSKEAVKQRISSLLNDNLFNSLKIKLGSSMELMLTKKCFVKFIKILKTKKLM